MTIYRINMDLPEEAKEEHEHAACRLAGAVDTVHTVVSTAGEEIYQGTDANTFRKRMPTCRRAFLLMERVCARRN